MGGGRVVITHSSRHCKCPDSARRALEVAAAGGWRGAASGKGGETTGGDATSATATALCRQGQFKR